MALSVVDLYRQVLPRTNCGDCGYPTCMAFASMVVSNNKIIMATSGKRETIDGHAQSMLEGLRKRFEIGLSRRLPAGRSV